MPRGRPARRWPLRWPGWQSAPTCRDGRAKAFVCTPRCAPPATWSPRPSPTRTRSVRDLDSHLQHGLVAAADGDAPLVLLAGLHDRLLEVDRDADLVLLAGGDGDVPGVDFQAERDHRAGRVTQVARLELDPARAQVPVDHRHRALGGL